MTLRCQGSLAIESFERLNLRNQTQFYEDELKQIEYPSHSEEGSGSNTGTTRTFPQDERRFTTYSSFTIVLKKGFETQFQVTPPIPGG